eukprot:3867320-Prymnesium_polylepis.1
MTARRCGGLRRDIDDEAVRRGRRVEQRAEARVEDEGSERVDGEDLCRLGCGDLVELEQPA